MTTDALWDQYAVEYSKLYQLRPLRRALQDVIEAADLVDGHRVLDVGCGVGLLLRALADAGLSPQVTELDSSAAMLDQAQATYRQLADRWPTARVDFQLADLNQDPSSWRLLGHYDHLVLVNSLYTAQDPRLVLTRLASLAQPGATMVVSTPQAEPNMEIILQQHLATVAQEGGDPQAEQARIMTEFATIIQINQHIVAQGAAGTFHFPDEAGLCAWFAGTGWRLRLLHTTYADQNWLAVAERECHRGDPDAQAMAG